MIITFAGHRFVHNHDEIKKRVKAAIREVVITNEALVCLCGGYGEFDNICASACRELKTEGMNVTIVYVTPYITLSEQKKINERQSTLPYDSIFYPPIENTPLKFAISKRNEWMMSEADIVISYIKHNYGGAYKSVTCAKRKKKK